MRGSRLLFRGVLVASVGFVVGCGPAYEVGSFDHYGRVEEPRMRSVGCLDVRLRPRGEGEVGRAWVAIDYDFGNRCRSPVEVDFQGVAVYGDSGRGMTLMHLFDPREEVVAGTLDGEGFASEALAYAPSDAGADTLGRVCVDVTGLVPASDEQELGPDRERVAPVCFRRAGGALVVEARR